jgi:hypothetical protein
MSTNYEAPHCAAPSITSYLFGPNILLRTLSLCSSLNVRDHVSHPYKTSGRIKWSWCFILLYLICPKVKALCSSKTCVLTYKSKLGYNPEDSNVCIKYVGTSNVEVFFRSAGLDYITFSMWDLALIRSAALLSCLALRQIRWYWLVV